MEYTRRLYGAIGGRYANLNSRIWGSLGPIHQSEHFTMGSRAVEFVTDCSLALGGFTQLDHILLRKKAPLQWSSIDRDFNLKDSSRDVLRHSRWDDDRYCLEYFDMEVMKPAEHDALLDGSGLWVWLNIENPWAYSKPKDAPLVSNQGKWVESSVVGVYRRRAWAFFDDERWYPDLYKFSTVADIISRGESKIHEV
ncbi:hypothetical protein HIM_06818 [Hirsutella minnesotensis 3608]|uniref:Uncharacterized protein n=1 Tax=Hirsutella minnesotensis 3608 TaxID=1043627 RepID=A0A0F7ZNG3_9HYPO|nr:hypothetical protein HIM_06818 [Hirsutella minnesotensis 3608]